ncbi:MAG: DUF4129 domain-containing protein [Oscillospiraceae bacterium]|nr:DUF4129 domain-containing protein [Oscillospiraceae bacterium]
MSRTASWFCRTAIIACNAAAMGFLYSVAVFRDNGMQRMPGFFIWTAFVLICVLVHTFMQAKERTIRAYISVAAVFFTVQCAVCFIFVKGYSTVGTVLFSLLFWMFSYYRCFTLATKGTKQSHVTDNFDLSVVILLLSAACAVMSEMETRVMYCPAGAAVLSFAALIWARADAGRGSADTGRSVRGSSLIVGSVIVIAGAAAGAAVLFEDAIRTAVKAAVTAVVTAVRWVAHQIAELLMLLSGGMDSEPGGAIDGIDGIPAGEGSGAEEMFFENEWAFRAVLIAVIALIAAVIVIRFITGRHRLGTITVGRAEGRTVRRRRRPLRDALSALMQRIRYIADCTVYRNTARGLFAWLLRRGRAMRVARGRSETPRQYLFRLAERFPESADALDRFAPQLDAELFSPCGGGLDAHEIVRLRRAIATGISRSNRQKT